MSFRLTLKLEGAAHPIPPGDGKDEAFVAWCEENDVHPLNGLRRGYWSRYSTYIRDAAWVVHLDLGETILLSDEEMHELVEPGTIIP